MQRPVLAMPVAPTAPLAPAAPLAAAPASSTAVRADPGRRISLATQLQVRLTCLTCLTCLLTPADGTEAARLTGLYESI